MKRIIVLLISTACLMFSLAGCGESYTCYKCDTTTREAYFDASGKIEWVLCKDCARSYWAPMSCEAFKVS